MNDDDANCNLDDEARAGLREGRAGPSPRAPRLRGPRGTSARGPAPCEDPRGGASALGTTHGSVSGVRLAHFGAPQCGLLILRKIIKIVATRCYILRLKCTKFDFGWGSAPDPAGGVYSAPPDPLPALRGPYF